MPMSSWFKGKLSKSSSPSSTKVSPRTNRSSAKDSSKARSFDEAVAAREAAAIADLHNGSSPRCTSLASQRGSAASGPAFFSPSSPSPSPLLSPTQAHPLPMPQSASAATPQGSVSSISSSGSSDDGAPDLATYRYADHPNTPRGRSQAPDFRRKHFPTEPSSPVPEQDRLSHNFTVSPRRAAANHATYFNTPHDAPAAAAHNQQRTVASIDTRSRTGSLSPGPRPRGYGVPGSPISTAQMFCLAPDSPMGKQQDDQRSLHPLPLPPGSPTSPASSSHSLQAKWMKGKLLGRGTFGHVYAGFNSGSGQMCAIKEVEIISGDSNSKECLKQLHQEINMLSQLQHPNIVRYYGSELVDSSLSVYLEYVSGGSIHKLLQEYGPFSEPVIRSYAGQILSGLAYLHARNTIHRDIKGANILVGSNGEVKLADFGMAKHISSYASIHSFKGSPYWMAPEVIMNSNGYSLPVDIWSLGCTIIEMASSKPPWNSFTGVQAIFKIGNSKDIPEIPEHLSNEAKNFVKLCLQRDPSARPTAAKLLEHPFVRDQAKTNFSMASTRDAYHVADGTRSPTMTPVDLTFNRSRSPIRDGNFSMRHTIAHSPALKNPSEILGSLRTNMSLPVSPCSSPLRQFKQSNWSCLPSPPHPIQAMVNATSPYSTCSPYQNGVSNRYTDRWPDVSAAVSRSPYGSSRTIQ